MIHDAYIAFGSNLGDRKKNILDAMSMIKKAGMKFARISTIYETKPYGFTDQGDFLNCVALVKTELTPMTLLETLLGIEEELGRVREKKWGPRTIDLDIIFYDRKIVNFAQLIIPHEDMHNRFFVLEPLSEIAPNYVHPVFHKSVFELLKALKEVSA